MITDGDFSKITAEGERIMSAEFSFLKELGTDRSSLIKGLQLVQQQEGYVSDEAIEAVAAHFGMAPAEV